MALFWSTLPTPQSALPSIPTSRSTSNINTIPIGPQYIPVRFIATKTRVSTRSRDGLERRRCGAESTPFPELSEGARAVTRPEVAVLRLGVDLQENWSFNCSARIPDIKTGLGRKMV